MDTSELSKPSFRPLGAARRKAIMVPQNELIRPGFKIALIYLPFGNLHMPSIGLTQLKEVIKQQFKERVSVDIYYLTFDFAHYLGLELYDSIVTSPQHNNSGLGGWIFRQSAFPEAPDNSEEFYQRFYPWQNKQTFELKNLIEEKRRGMDDFLISLITRYNLADTQIVGFSSMFHQNIACFALARKIKDINPNVITVMGGANCEAPMGPAIARHIDQIDFTFSGPALKSFPDFVQKCMDEQLDETVYISGVYGKKHHEFAQTQVEVEPFLFSGRGTSLIAHGHKGSIAVASEQILLLEQNPHIHKHGTHGEELDINVKIKLDYEPFLNSLEQFFPNHEVKPVLTFETSRGCWWGEKAHCTFCGLNDLTIKSRTMCAENAIELFNSLFQYAPRCTRFLSVDNILPKSFLRDVLPHIEPPPNVVILYESKSDIDEDSLQIISRAGIKMIQPGIEALSSHALKLMQKGSTVFVNLRLLKNCVLHEIYPAWNVLIGTPGEVEEIYEKYVHDIPLFIHLPPPTGVWSVEFHRFSPNFENAEALGLDLHPREFCMLTYPFEEEILRDIVWNFEDHNINATHFVYVARWLGKIREQIDMWQSRWDGRQANLLHPFLYIKEGVKGFVVYDTRSGVAVEHEISDFGKQIIDQLARPLTIERLSALFRDRSVSHVEHEISLLQQHGLLFQEDDTFFSLVLPRDPLPRRHWDQWPTGWRAY